MSLLSPLLSLPLGIRTSFHLFFKILSRKTLFYELVGGATEHYRDFHNLLLSSARTGQRTPWAHCAQGPGRSRSLPARRSRGVGPYRAHTRETPARRGEASLLRRQGYLYTDRRRETAPAPRCGQGPWINRSRRPARYQALVPPRPCHHDLKKILQHYGVFLQVPGVFSIFRPRACTYRSEPDSCRLAYGTAPFGPIACKQLLMDVPCVYVH